MTFGDFYEIAKYANENWKGSFTKEEVKDNAKIYHADFVWSKGNGTIATSIKTLMDNLKEDIKVMPDLEQPKKWLNQMLMELVWIDTEGFDYSEMDKWSKENVLRTT